MSQQKTCCNKERNKSVEQQMLWLSKTYGVPFIVEKLRLVVKEKQTFKSRKETKSVLKMRQLL